MSTEEVLRFLGEEFDAPREDALFHILPVPYEKTVSYGHGTAMGPKAILRASWQVETFDGVSVPADHGIFTAAPLDCSGGADKVLGDIGDACRNSLAGGHIPVVLGGEHTVTVGAVRGLYQLRPDFGVIQFDAHADLRDEYQGDSLSHACVMKRLLDDGIPICQIGIRSLSYEEHCLQQQRQLPVHTAAALHRQGLPDCVVPDGFPENVYVTVDVDAFDPATVPGVGTPEPGGIDWYMFHQLFAQILKQRQVIGVDFVELAPVPESIVSDFAVARLVYNVLGMLGRAQRP